MILIINSAAHALYIWVYIFIRRMGYALAIWVNRKSALECERERERASKRVSEGVWIIESRLYGVASEYAPNRWWWKTERNTKANSVWNTESVSSKLRSIQNSVRDWMSYKEEQQKGEKARACLWFSACTICAFSGILRYDQQQQQQHIHNNSTLTDTQPSQQRFHTFPTGTLKYRAWKTEEPKQKYQM